MFVAYGSQLERAVAFPYDSPTLKFTGSVRFVLQTVSWLCLCCLLIYVCAHCLNFPRELL